MTPEQRARLVDLATYPVSAQSQEAVKAALAHIDALEQNKLVDGNCIKALAAEVERLKAGTYTDAESRTWWSDAHMKRAELEAKTYQDLLQKETARATAAEQRATQAAKWRLEWRRVFRVTKARLREVEAERDETIRGRDAVAVLLSQAEQTAAALAKLVALMDEHHSASDRMWVQIDARKLGLDVYLAAALHGQAAQEDARAPE